MGAITSQQAAEAGTPASNQDRYKWVALSNTTLSMMMATIDGSIVIIAMPAIFRGIHLSPLAPGNISYVLWMIMGYLLVQAVLVVTLGRLGDMFGRVKIYNLGFVVFTLASIALSFDPAQGSAGALWLILWRVGQAFGGAMLMANSAAILTDAFPAKQRGMALGVNQVVGHRRPVHRAAAGRRARRLGLARGVLGERAHRRLGHILGLPQPARDRHHQAGPDRLGRQCPVRRRRHQPAGRDHVRHPAVRRPPDRLDEPEGPDRADRRGRAPGHLRHRRDEDRRADVPDEPVQDPRVRRRERGQPDGLDRARWPSVHARHLAGRDLAAPARLRLHRHAPVGGHLHAAADGGLPDRRTDLRHAVGPVRHRGSSPPPGCCWRRARSLVCCCSR